MATYTCKNLHTFRCKKSYIILIVVDPSRKQRTVDIRRDMDNRVACLSHEVALDSRRLLRSCNVILWPHWCYKSERVCIRCWPVIEFKPYQGFPAEQTLYHYEFPTNQYISLLAGDKVIFGASLSFCHKSYHLLKRVGNVNDYLFPAIRCWYYRAQTRHIIMYRIVIKEA